MVMIVAFVAVMISGSGSVCIALWVGWHALRHPAAEGDWLASCALATFGFGGAMVLTAGRALQWW